MFQKRNNMDLEMILILLKEESHLREIARKLNASPATIMRKMKVLFKQNVVDYKTKGRNKVFFVKKSLQAKNHVFNAERYKLIKLIEKYPVFNVIIDNLLKDVKEEMVVIFGSYAKFSAKDDSDIDIYIETSSRKVKEKTEMVNLKIRAKIGLFDRESNLIKEIIKDHVILRGAETFYEKTGFFG